MSLFWERDGKIFHDYYAEHKDELNSFAEIGVNYYTYSRLKAQIHDGKEVHLFEPVPACYQDIVKQTANYPNVKVYDTAISYRRGKTAIYNEGLSAFIDDVRGKAPCHVIGYYDMPNSRQVEESEIFTVKCDTFDKFDDGRFDVVFIDAEGCEWYVLKKMVSRPKILGLEIRYGDKDHTFKVEIENWLNENGYQAWFDEGTDTYYLRYQR